MKIHVDETELKFFIQNEVMKQLRNSQVASKGYVCSEIQDRMRQHSQGYDHQKMREERGEISPNARSMINILMENQRKRDARLGTLEKQVKKLFAWKDEFYAGVNTISLQLDALTTKIDEVISDVTKDGPLPEDNVILEDTSYNDVIYRYLDEIRKLLDKPGQMRGAMEIKIHRKITELENYIDGGGRYNK